jgi:hypothetical protein
MCSILVEKGSGKGNVAAELLFSEWWNPELSRTERM